MTLEAHLSQGHRERLRQRFQSDPEALSDVEQLEMLLTYAIPRRDVAPLAGDLLVRFGSLQEVFAAPVSALMEVEGIGESTVLFIQLIHHLMNILESSVEMSPKQTSPQLSLFDLDSQAAAPVLPGAKEQPDVKERPMRVFANDEVANSLALLPKAASFSSFDGFKQFLCEKLPYNAAETRARRANNILERFYPTGQIDTPLTYFALNCSSQADLQPVVFYHVFKAEPIAAKIAEEVIWPALPIGRVERSQVNEFILHYMPEIKSSSLGKILESLNHTNSLTGTGTTDKKGLRFQLRRGSLESFLYILTSEYPQPGIYSFESLYSGPLYHWLLWDREWMRRQLYNLQDFGILSKVSEIDTVRQFTLALDQPAALRTFFEHPQRSQLAVREDFRNLGDFGNLNDED